MKLLSRNTETLKVLPHMELLRMHYYPHSSKYNNSMTIEVSIDGLGKIECSDIQLSEETKNAIRSDCLLGIKKKLGL